MKHLKLFEDFSTWAIVGGFAAGIIFRIINNYLKSKKNDNSYAENVEFIKGSIMRIIDKGRAKCIKAKNESDFISIKIEVPGTKTINMKLNKQNLNLDIENYDSIPLSKEEYDKLYNAIYFYIV